MINAIACSTPDFNSALKTGVCGIGPLDIFEANGFRCQNGGQNGNFVSRSCITRSIPSKECLGRICSPLLYSGCATRWRTLPFAAGVGPGNGCGHRWRFRRTSWSRKFLQRIIKNQRQTCPIFKPFHYLLRFFCRPYYFQFETIYPQSNLYDGLLGGSHSAWLCARYDSKRSGADGAGGGVEPMCRITYASFNALKSLDPEVCHPFDRDRVGYRRVSRRQLWLWNRWMRLLAEEPKFMGKF